MYIYLHVYRYVYIYLYIYLYIDVYVAMHLYSPISFAVGVLAVFKGSAPRPRGFSKKNANTFVEKNRFFRLERRSSQEKRGSKKIPAFLSRNIRFLLRKRIFLEKKSVSGWLVCVFLEKKACLDGWFPKQFVRVTRAMAISSVWNSAVFVDKNSLLWSSRRISRELRGTAMEGHRFCRYK